VEFHGYIEKCIKEGKLPQEENDILMSLLHGDLQEERREGKVFTKANLFSNSKESEQQQKQQNSLY